MRIMEIREIEVRLERSLANAVVDFSRHTVSLVALISDRMRDGRPVAGVAFNSIGRFAQGGILRGRMNQRVLETGDRLLDEAGDLDPAQVLAAAMKDEKPGGHGDRASAAAVLELAAWDLKAKLAGMTASAAIARAHGRQADRTVHVYAAGGYYHPEDGLARLRDEIGKFVAAGYRHAKIKIGGASWDHDRARIEAAAAVLGDAGALAVDANGRYARDEALAMAERLAPYGLRWFEEAGDPLDFALMAELAAAYPGTLATGENLFSRQDAVNLLRYGGMRPGQDVFQMDAGLSYGLTEYAAMVDAMELAGHDRRQAMPHGGHLINLHIVAGLGLGGCESYPAVFQPFGGYLPELVIEDGRIALPDHDGFGLEHKPELAPHIERLLG